MESHAARQASWLELQQQLERERGWSGRLRALRTSSRVALVACFALAPTALMALRHRPTLAHGAIAGLVVVLAAALLGSLGEPRRDTRRAWLAWLSALLPLAGALTLGELGATPHDDHGKGASAAACFGLGAAYAAPALLLALVISRTPIRNWTEVAMLAGLCGISASLMLDMHCASRQLAHLVLGHAGIGVAWAAAYQAATTGSDSSSGRSNIKTISKMS